MALTTITISNLESAPYNNMMEILNNRSNIVDPKDPQGTRDFIYDSDPFMKAIDFSGMPYIILELPTHSGIKPTTDGKHEEITWIYNVTIRTAKDGSGGGTKDVGRGEYLGIADDLNETCKSLTIRDSLDAVNMPRLIITKLSSDTLSVNQKILYEGRYELQHITRLAVSD